MSRLRTTAGWPILAVALVTLTACRRDGAGAPTPQQDDFLSRAVFADERLWLLSDRGDLSSVAPGEGHRLAAGLPGRVLDACVRAGHLEAVTCEGADCEGWSVRVRDGKEWRPRAVVPALGERFLALSCSESGDALVTSRRVIRIATGKTTAVEFPQQLLRGVPSVHAAGDAVFVGLNVGEWGGGLHRINPSGTVTTIESNGGGELCGGPLNTECDPVNAIIDDPWHPGCVAAAIGLVHFSPHGRIVQICGNEVRRVYFKPYREAKPRTSGRRGDEPHETVAFSGLARVGNRVLAVGLDGLYRFDDWEHVTVTPLPSFASIDGVGISFGLPDVALVLTGVNQRNSISGNVPLLAPR